MTTYGFVKWVEGARIFARPRAVNASCSGTDEQDTFSSCRASAAGTCDVPSDATLTGDACVCATLGDYNSKFSACILGTPFSACIDPNNDQIMATWYSEHCGSSPSSTPAATTTVASTPRNTPTPSATPSATPTSSSEPVSTPISTTPAPSPTPSTSSPQPSIPKSSSSPSSSTVQTSEQPSSSPEPTSEYHSSRTPQITPSAVPAPSLVPVTVVTRIPAQTTGNSPSSFSTHSPIPKWTGSGNLLQGYCATPEFSLLDGPTAYWAPVIGCNGDKPDCCPFDIPPSTIPGVSTPVTIVVTIPASQASNIPTGGSGGFPVAVQPAQATLDRCPNDYHSIGNGCCPSNYFPWSTAFGGQTPCYSTLPIATSPPPIPDSVAATATASASISPKPTSAIVNVVYAMQYPVKPSGAGLASNAKIGIGAGAGAAAVIFGVLISLLIWKHKAHKRDKAELERRGGITPVQDSTRQNIAANNMLTSSTGAAAWKQGSAPRVQSRFTESLGEPTLPNVGAPTAHSADWRPRQQTAPPPVPGAYTRNSISYEQQQQRYPSPPLPGGYAEVHAEDAAQHRRYSNVSPPIPDPRYDSAPPNMSELQGEGYFQQQGYQAPPVGQNWTQTNGGYQNAAQMQGEPQWQQPPPPGVQTRYHEAPAGRM